MLVAQKTSLLLDVEETTVQENHKEVMCKWGHINLTRRSNRECRTCHSIRNAQKQYRLKFEQTPKGKYAIMKRHLRRRIAQKRQRIAELERTIT